MNRRNTKIHTDDPVCGLPGSLSERKNRSAPQGNAITAFFAHCLGERFYLLGFLPVLAAVLLLLYLPWYRAERHQRMLCARNQVAV